LIKEKEVKHICDVNTDKLPSLDFFDEFPERKCPVFAAREIAEKGRALSCGKGTFCRDGVTQLAFILDGIVRNKAREGDMKLLLQLCKNISLASDCAMSGHVSALIVSSIEKQRERWDDHLIRRQCPDMICSGFISYYIAPDKCTGCGKCVPVCAGRAVTGRNAYIHVIEDDLCTCCGLCADACPENAVLIAGSVKPRVPDEPVPAGSFSPEPTRRRRRRE
jgi:NADH-quinone oxidoreductase subunit F